jgi:hypothetical protein
MTRRRQGIHPCAPWTSPLLLLGLLDLAPISAHAQSVVGTDNVRVATSADDAEERQTGSMDLTSSDLELVLHKDLQKVGIRFENVTVPAGATVAHAYIQFTVDETPSSATTLTIRGERAANAAPFAATAGDISRRAPTVAAVAWTPPSWPSVGAAGLAQQTPNIGAMIQEIVRGSGWASGNALVVIITGSGKRVAEAYNGDASRAPLLHVEYAAGP